MVSSTIKKAMLYSLATSAMVAGSVAYAHTGVKDTGTEGKSQYTAFTITHGCNNNEGTLKLKPVVAQSVVFPNADDSEFFKIDPVSGAETPTTLTEHIDTSLAFLDLGPGMVQDRNVFKKQWEVTDATGRVRGIVLTNGKLDTTAVGIIPVRIGGVKFKADSCAKSLKVRIAIANYCTKSKNVNADNRSDIWIGGPTPKFNDGGVLPHDWETDPFWPTYTIERSTELKPECGEGFDIAVQPSASDIDGYLPIKGYWPQ